MKIDRFIPSTERGVKLHVVQWIPKDEPKGAVQIVHGMAEHIMRYEEVANFLMNQGYVVVGHDHLGHGMSLNQDKEFGFFSEVNGNEKVLTDIYTVLRDAKQQFSELPYFLMGHSMGSFLSRQFVHTYYDIPISGAIFVGTGHPPSGQLKSAKALTSILIKLKGKHYRSKLVDSMLFGSKDFKALPKTDPLRWINSIEEEVQIYKDDPACGFTFTLQAFQDMFVGILTLKDKENLKKIKKNLPVLFISGQDDPVGAMGKAVVQAAKSLEDVGLNDVEVKLYSGARHEVLRDHSKHQVFEDVVKFLEKNSSQGITNK